MSNDKDINAEIDKLELSETSKKLLKRMEKERKEIAVNSIKMAYKIGEEQKRQEEAREAFFQQIGAKSIPKELDKTIVCNGATLNCPYATIEASKEMIQNSRYPIPKISKVPSIAPVMEFKVTTIGALLMGRDLIGTIDDNKGENFLPFPSIRCEKNGNKPCEINKVGGIWSKYSNKLFVDSKNALLKESELECNAYKAKLTIVDNGQNPEIKNAEFDQYFTPTDREIAKGIAATAIVFLITKSIVASIKEAGGIVVVAETFNSGYSTGGYIGGIAAVQGETGIVSKFINAGQHAATAISSFGGEKKIEEMKGVVGELGISMIDNANKAFDVYDILNIGIVSAKKGGKINETNKKIINHNNKLDSEIKLYKDSNLGEFEFTYNKMMEMKLKKQMLNTIGFGETSRRVMMAGLKEGVGYFYDKTEEELQNLSIEAASNLLSDWGTHYSQVRYAKNPFVIGNIEIK
nr:PAAR-like protein [uncultured Leptotrichia sp.]